MIIGITGGTGCGKTTLLQIIEARGGLVIDCDKVYRDLLQTDKHLLAAIENRFPGVVEQGVLQRKKLGEIVFSDEKALEDLNRITHDAVKKKVLDLLSPRPKLAAIDAIALFESGLNELCKPTVAVTAPKEDRVARLMARDTITKEYALKRIDAQKSSEEYSALCDYTLINDGDYDTFYAKCLAFLTELGIIKTTSEKE